MARLSPEEGFEILKDRVKDATKGIFPIVGRAHTLELHDIDIPSDLNIDDIRSQKEAKLAGRTWAVPVEATLALKDNQSGAVIDKQKIKLMNLPKYTRRYSHIIDGKEYQIDNQWRLKAGAYSMVKNDGSLETHFNTAGLKGRGFKVGFDPASRAFTMEYDNKHLPLLPLLHGLGVPPDEVEKAWGKDIVQANAADPHKPVMRFHEIVTGEKAPSLDVAKNTLQMTMHETQQNPDVNKITLGAPHTNTNGDAILAASKKLLGISRGTEKSDPRDSLMFKELHSLEDFVGERIQKGSREITRKIKNTLDRKGRSVREVVGPDVFNRTVRSLFTGPSGLSNTPEQLNPLEMISNQMKTTITGEGGIQSEHRITDEAKLVDPSHMGFLDPLHTPEGQSTGVSLRLPVGVSKKGNDVFIRMYNLKSGKFESVNPTKVMDSRVVLPDQVRWEKGKPVAVDKQVTMSGVGNEIEHGPLDSADYVMSDPIQLFSMSTNMIPFMAADHPGRSTMAGRHMEQAISLKDRKTPLVQSLAGNVSFDKLVGGFASHQSPVDGTVTKIKSDAIVVKGEDGKSKEVQIYNNFPLNADKIFIHSEPLVQIGEKVKKGQVIADTNHTKNGVLALGTNLRVAYMPYKGYNYEDGVVLSETAAKKLSSEHLYRKELDREDTHVLDKKRFRAYAPTALTKDQAAKLDDEGVIASGHVVLPGDTLIAALQQKNENERREDSELAKLHKSIVKPLKDVSVKWDEDYPGIVQEVSKRGKNVSVHVKTLQPLEVGDKIAGRHGNKGIVVKLIPDHEMPHTTDGRPVEVLMNPTGVPGRTNLGQILEASAGKIAEKTGKTYYVKNFEPGVDLHKRVSDELKQHGLPDKEDVIDPVTGKVLGQALVGPAHILKLKHIVESKMIARSGGSGYTYDRNMIPKGGGPHGAQSLGALGLYAMLAHGSVHNLREMNTVKCFTWGTLVLTDDGPMQIGKIVNQKRQVRVLSRNHETGELEYKKVVNFWKRPIVGEALVELEYHAAGESGVFTKHFLRATRNHKIYNGRAQKMAAGEISGRDVLITAPVPTQYQKDVMVGSLLGDGCMQVRNGPFPAFQERHGADQREYMQYKAAILADFSNREVRPYNAGHDGFNVGQTMYEWGTLAQPAFYDLYKSFYANGVRVVPENIDKLLSPVALAILYQDDGSFTRTRRSQMLRIHVGVLSARCCRRLAKAIQKLVGVRFSVKDEISEYNGRPAIQRYLYLGTRPEVERFVEFVRPFVHPCMAYKVMGRSCGKKLLDPKLAANAEEKLVPVPVVVRPAKPQKWDGAYLYDIEVEDNHNYFANGILVGNSDAAQSDQFWAALQAGEVLPAPRPTFAYNKFMSYLKGLGVNPKKEGNSLTLVPMTDKQVLDMSNGEVKDAAKWVRAKNMSPEKGGLFDQHITGGVEGTKWSHMRLPEPMPNPVFESAIQTVTNLSGSDFEDLVAGRKGLDKNTKQLVPSDTAGALLGGKAVNHLLASVDVDKELKAAHEEINKPGLKGNRLDRVNKKIKYLNALKKADLHPRDAYMMQNVPILPPNMRPLSVLPNNTISEDDLNGLYKYVHLSGKKYQELSPHIPEDDESKVALREEMYDGLRALAGIGGYPKQVRRGILDIIAGKRVIDPSSGAKGGSPKFGFFQSKLIQRKQDLTMRSTIVPEPSLGFDEVGIPKPAALELYKPFVVRELRLLQGVTPLQARAQIEKGGEIVDRALERVITSRPILLKRDPVLHKYGVQAFKPRLVSGKAIQVHPLVTSGFNADFDGDAMGAFVPVSADAVQEAYKMMPSNNLFSPSSGAIMYAPTQEAKLGLYGVTKMGKNSGKSYKTIQEVEAAARKGEVHLNDVIDVSGVKSSVGRFLVAGALPETMRKEILTRPTPLNSKAQQELLTRLAREHKNDYGVIVNKLKDLGNAWSTQTAFSIGLSDIAPERSLRDQIIQAADKELKGYTGSKKDEKAVQLYSKATEDMHSHLTKQSDDSSNLVLMNRAGIKPSVDTLRQIKMAPMLVVDAKGRTIPTPIRKSYAEGLDVSGYWTSMSGARKGVIQKVQSVEEPGYASKLVMQTVMNNLITDHDCGTDKGISLNVDEKDILDRFTAIPIKAGNKTIPAGTLVTPELKSTLRNNNIGKVVVRSPMRCLHGPGICQKCYGLDENGHLPDKGTNVGIIAGQALGERSVQLAMKSFHTGGSAAAKSELVDEFQQVKNLFELPATLPGSAILSTVSGKVTDIKKDPAGGYDVVIDGKKHYVPQSRGVPMYNGVHLKKGVEVKKGAALSGGSINPHELLDLTGIEHTQGHLANALYDIYKDEGIRRRNVEVVVKGLTNLTKIEHPGSSDEFIRGDFAPTTRVAAINRSLPKDAKPIVHKPVLKGVDIMPLAMQEDWMAKLNHERLATTVVEAAQRGWASHIHGLHPVPAVAYAAEIGRSSKPGEY